MFIKNKQKLTKTAVKATVIAIAAMFGTNAYAVGAVGIQSTWTAGNQLSAGTSTITANQTNIGSKNAFTSNPLLFDSAWAHAGRWFTFENTLNGVDVDVSVTGTFYSPGVTVWASGASEFDGGTEGFPGDTFIDGTFGTPHSFNATGAMGDNGTLWMADGQGGNMVETLGYAVANPSINSTSGTGWGETIQSGAHDVSLTNTYESGVTGSTTADSVSLSFDDLAAGWYTVYVGGTDGSVVTPGGSSAEYGLVVSAVPEAETWAMLLAGLGLIGWRLRKQQPTTSWNMTAA